MSIVRSALIIGVALLAATAARAQSAVEKVSPVYTVATLLVGIGSTSSVGGRPPAADGSTTMFLTGSSPSIVDQVVQMGEDLAGLQQKLKATFQLASVHTVASMATWLSPGREMVLRSASGEQTLVVRGAGRSHGTQPPFVAVLPKEGGEAGDYERGYVAGRMAGALAANFHVKLTAGQRTVFDRPMAVALGHRSVFARLGGPDGALYFVVVAAPLSSADRARGSGAPVPEPDKRIRAPRLLSGDDPVPPAGIDLGPEGTRVVLTGTLGVNGRVSNIKVVRAAEGLTELAVAAFRARRYEPARDESGQAIEVQVAAVMLFRNRGGA